MIRKVLMVLLCALSIGNMAFASRESDTIEASLAYLLGSLEAWGSWLDPTNEIGLLPEAEGRFMIPTAPILQTGGTTLSGGIGIMGFAQPIIISENEVPQGFSENERLYEPFPINFSNSIEDIFREVPYLDRFAYQYGVQINGSIVQIYRKPIARELTLRFLLQQMGATPEVAEAWVKEYVKIAQLPQTLQLAWLIAGNPLAEDYQSHIEDILAETDLSGLLMPNSKIEGLSSPQAPNSQLANQDPFWAEVQKQPLVTAFTELLSDVSEDVKRSFIIFLFFLEPTSPIAQETSTGIRSTGFSSSAQGTRVSENSNSPATSQADPKNSVSVANTNLANIKSSVFIATSLDGFIAREDGNLDWLDAANAMIPAGEDLGYSAFMASIDVVVMGRGTYEKVLSFSQWPYENKSVIVLSSKTLDIPAALKNSVTHSSETPQELHARLSQAGAKRLYIDGGITIQRFLAAGLIDDMTITLIPTVLGNGIPLFGRAEKDILLKHIETKTYEGGFVQLTYQVAKRQ